MEFTHEQEVAGKIELDIKEAMSALKELIKQKDERIAQLEKYEAMLSTVHTDLMVLVLGDEYAPEQSEETFRQV